MMFYLACAIGGIGLSCVLLRRNLFGVFVGVQLLILGATLISCLAGIRVGNSAEGNVLSLFVILAGVAHLVGGYALLVRMLYLKNVTKMSELRSLRR